jgi:hypothetical protein
MEIHATLLKIMTHVSCATYGRQLNISYGVSLYHRRYMWYLCCIKWKKKKKKKNLNLKTFFKKKIFWMQKLGVDNHLHFGEWATTPNLQNGVAETIPVWLRGGFGHFISASLEVVRGQPFILFFLWPFKGGRTTPTCKMRVVWPPPNWP